MWQQTMLRRKKHGDMAGWNDQNKIAHKSDNEVMNQKILDYVGWLKRYLDRVKQNKQNRTFQNDEKKYLEEGGECTRIYWQLDAMVAKWFRSKIWEIKNRKFECINNKRKELQGLEDGPCNC